MQLITYYFEYDFDEDILLSKKMEEMACLPVGMEGVRRTKRR